jgi:hypothetical protein
MAYPTKRINANGNKASPYCTPFRKGNISNVCLSGLYYRIYLFIFLIHQIGLGTILLLYNGNRVQQPGCGVNHPLPSTAEVKARVELHLYSPLGLHGMF